MPRSIEKGTHRATEDRSAPAKLFLIGYRGCGKSTIGKIVAQRLGWRLLDTDAMIVSAAGTSIAEIFHRQGEAEFRRLETDAIAKAIADPAPTVVSLGGGAPINPTNQSMLRVSGKTVWLRANPATLWQRIRLDEQTASQRPDLTQQGGLAEVEEILRLRTPIYRECCDKIVDVDHASPESIVEIVVAWFESECNRDDAEEEGKSC